MLLVGLTGGIGSGKTTVAGMLADRGAVVIDADALARDAVEPGTPGHDAVVRRFGNGVVHPDGSLDRPELAAIVFTDEGARRDLEAIVHPEVRRGIAEIVAAHVGTDHVVVLDSPLLIETSANDDCDVVVVVAAQPQTQIGRIVARGMDEADARARLATQMPLADKAEVADVVLDNEGTVDELRDQVERLWVELRDRARSAG
jgi:dephospho-CoA kinase